MQSEEEELIDGELEYDAQLAHGGDRSAFEYVPVGQLTHVPLLEAAS